MGGCPPFRGIDSFGYGLYFCLFCRYGDGGGPAGYTCCQCQLYGLPCPASSVELYKIAGRQHPPRGLGKEISGVAARRPDRTFREISAWLEKDDNAWLTTGGDHGWEEVPYWLKGYSSLAYILNDPEMIEETKYWIEGVFASCQPDGYFGPVNERNGKRELWAQMIMLWCLQSYYEYSQDRRVIDLMTNYFKWQMTVPDDRLLEDFWENSRGGDNIISIYWLYSHTGDAFARIGRKDSSQHCGLDSVDLFAQLAQRKHCSMFP